MKEVLKVPNMKLFAGNATPELAQKIADRLFIKLGSADVGRFSDGEIHVQINENVRGDDIFIVQSTCAPTNDNLMELICRSYYCGNPILWLRTSRPSRSFKPCSNYS